jgi:hypothetical protein
VEPVLLAARPRVLQLAPRRLGGRPDVELTLLRHASSAGEDLRGGLVGLAAAAGGQHHDHHEHGDRQQASDGVAHQLLALLGLTLLALALLALAAQRLLLLSAVRHGGEA